MLIDDPIPLEDLWGGRNDPDHQCAWVENGVKKFGTFRASQLQCVHADGAPRNYDDET